MSHYNEFALFSAIPDPDGEVVVVVVVDKQTLGPLEQLEQLSSKVQLSVMVHILLLESKVKFVHPGVAAQAS